MTEYSYDLHVHSCLSPCADDDMTPANIAGMAAINGLGIVALTDHNTTGNCPAFFHHAKRHGIIPVAGMEITTAEDIHLICLFEELDAAMEFDKEIAHHLLKIRNKPEIFGHQLLMDENDEVRGEIEHLLINATDLDVDGAYRLCMAYGGVCYPAHIDRVSNGMIAILGDIPPTPAFSAFELNDRQSYESYVSKYPILDKMNYVVSSDAHNLWSISEGENKVMLEDEPYSSAFVRHRLFEFLRGQAE